MELDIFSEGTEYISASRVAKKLGYSSDYVGQLCRAKKVNGKLVGRTWYVDFHSILSHKKSRKLGKPSGSTNLDKNSVSSVQHAERVILDRDHEVSGTQYLKATRFVYESEELPKFPELNKAVRVQDKFKIGKSEFWDARIVREGVAITLGIMAAVGAGLFTTENIAPKLAQEIEQKIGSLTLADDFANLAALPFTTDISDTIGSFFSGFKGLKDIALGALRVATTTKPTAPRVAVTPRPISAPVAPEVAPLAKQSALTSNTPYYDLGTLRGDLKAELESYINAKIGSASPVSIYNTISTPELRREILLADTRPVVTRQSESDVEHISSSVTRLATQGTFTNSTLIGASITGSTGEFTNLTFNIATGTSATTTNFFSTNLFSTTASSTNLYANFASFGQATSTGTFAITGSGSGITFYGSGNHDITAQSGTLRIGSNTIIGSIEALDNTVDIGTVGTRFDKIYANEINATTLVGTIDGGNVNAEAITVNFDNATADTENSYIAFERGSLSPNALLTWDATNDRFTFNSDLALVGGIGNGSLLVNSSTTLQNLTFINATGTSATTTNFFSTTASSTNLFSTNGNIGTLTTGPITSGLVNGQTISSSANFTGTLTATAGLSTLSNLLLTGSSTLQNFTSQNSTSTSATSTNFFATNASTTNLRANTSIIGYLTSLFGNFTNLLVNGSSTLQNFTFQNATGTSATTTNFVASNSLYLPSLTQGSVPFVGTGGLISQNNNNFHWDNSGTFLRLGTDQATTDKAQLVLNDNASFRGEFGYNESGNTIMHIANTYNSNSARFDVRMKGSADANSVLTVLGSGNVGIGDTTPDYLLDIAGTSGFDGLLTMTGSAANIALGSNYLSGDGGDEGLFVDSSGNVGVGTASPGAKLSVNGSGYFGAYTTNGIGNLYVGSQGETSAIYIDTADNANRGAFFVGRAARGTQASRTILQDGDEGGSFFSDGWDGSAYRSMASIRSNVDGTPGAGDMPGRLTFNTTADGASTPTERMRINSVGNISIGTTTPNNKLDIYSTTKSAIGFSGASGGTYKWTIGMDVSNGGRFSIASSTALGTTDRFVINGDGNVGIGDTTPDYLLDIAGTSGFDGLLTMTGSAANIALGSNYLSGDGGDEGLFVDSSGNVGIGTNSPASPLTLKQTNNGPGGGLRTIRQDTTGYADWFAGADGNAYVQLNASGYCGTTGGGTSWACSSDERLKDVNGSFDRSLTDLMGVDPILYRLKSAGSDSPIIAGFSAQNVLEMIPEAVTTGPDGHYLVDDRPIISALVNAVKEIGIISNTFKTNLVAWFADTANGITEIIAGTFRAKDQLCINNTCVTEAQLQALLVQAGGTNSGGGGNNDPGSQPAPDPEPEVIPDPEPETAPEEGESEPEPILETPPSEGNI